MAEVLAECDAEWAAHTPETRPPPCMRLPLVRLKVEHDDYSVVSSQRFGAMFAGRVANPADVLLWWRRLGGAARSGRALAAAFAADDDDAPPPELRDIAPALRVEDLLQKQVRCSALHVRERIDGAHSLTPSLRAPRSCEDRRWRCWIRRCCATACGDTSAVTRRPSEVRPAAQA